MLKTLKIPQEDIIYIDVLYKTHYLHNQLYHHISAQPM